MSTPEKKSRPMSFSGNLEDLEDDKKATSKKKWTMKFLKPAPAEVNFLNWIQWLIQTLCRIHFMRNGLYAERDFVKPQ